ncbi:MAG TPA: CorA family divalent cation transporter [Euzebya sp.]|nr:CorA family divalent cation transporter [Euzebya sp.]
MLSGCATYRAGVALPDTDTPVAALAAHGPGRLVWISLNDPSSEECQRLAGVLHLDREITTLLCDDSPRAGLHAIQDASVLLAGVARYDPDLDLVEIGSLTALMRPGLVVTLTRHTPPETTDLRRQLESRPGPLTHGPGHLVHHLIEAVVAGYGSVLGDLRTDVEVLERAAFSEDHIGDSITRRIYLLKREAIDFQHAAAALIDPLDDLANGDHVIAGDHGTPDWAQTRDRLGRLVDRSAVVSDLLTGVLTAYQTDVALRQNEDMRKISAWVAMAAVPTMVAGIYGMNFDHMPELSARWGYPIVLVATAITCLGLYRLFRHRHWL